MRALSIRRMLTAVVLVLVLGVGVAWATLRPSHARAWRPEQAVLPRVEITDGRAVIRDLRDFRYTAEGEVVPGYRDAEYDLGEVERVWFVLSPFSERWRGPAHAFLSFGFRDGRHLAVSVEARREAGEEYSVWKGMLKRYELMVVLGTEEDLVGLRAVTWDDPTYLYPVRATPEQARALLERLLARAQQVYERPEFYHTVGNNCTTNLVTEINQIATEKIPYGRSVLLPGYSDELAFRMGLLDTELPLAAARERFRINARAQTAWGEPDFSARIRVE